MAFSSEGNILGFPPQALGELVPSLSNGYYYATDGMYLTGKFAAYSAIYSSQPAVAAVVDKIATAAARLTVRVWDPTPATGKIEDKSSALAKLMANPCPEMSTFAFWRWTVSTYEIYGEVYWLKMRTESGQVIGYLPMHPSRTAVQRDKEGNLTYIFTLGVASAGILTAPEEDVVAFRRYNPINLMRGSSRLEPLRSTLLNEDAARRASQSWWQKGARPSIIITHPDELSQRAKDRIKTSFDARHSGADNAGGSAVLDEGMTAQVVQLTAEEMQYIESRKLNREEVCMVYDVPPPAVHILDHATFSNITEQMRMVYRDTMAPRLEDYESVMSFSVVPDFFPGGQRVIEFDMREVLRGDFETRADKAVLLRNAGIYTGNMAGELVGAPRSEDPEMDKVYINAAMVPAGSHNIEEIVPGEPNPAPPGSPPTNLTGGGQQGQPAVTSGKPPAIPAPPPAKNYFKGGDAQTLLDYWTTGDGADKISWGSPGDFDRCVTELGQYVDDPEGYCANAHYVALGVWPGQEDKALEGSKDWRTFMGRLGRAKSLTDVKQTLVEEHTKQLKKYFNRQKEYVKKVQRSKAAATDYGLDNDDWNTELSQILAPLASAAATTIGNLVAKTLDGEYKPDRLEQYLNTTSARSAFNINSTTVSQLNSWVQDKMKSSDDDDEGDDDEPDTDEFFDQQANTRSHLISVSMIVMLAGLASLVAAEQNGAATKTWTVTAGDPRPSHEALDGETVALGESFSNGMSGPGDVSGGADEVAGCTCELTFSKESE